ncbi:hypothetical protein BEP19_00955 [Ammoniphilus oxalaticus]|uniref:Uncharacterized protein n=1 Tax=Ammoniphilus oxalaticus TaxID=66863 RepID=A0A419SMM4_9BACL|nr:hypothetical protein [Ammoniphilus oxalaticus]RKD25544.1 hypothetical protein BEP19_00955 [Ammoniphilus oxalaticus]
MNNLLAIDRPTFQIGKMNADRFWLQCPDGRMLQIDADTKETLERLANDEAISAVSDIVGVEEEDILALLDRIGLDERSPFALIDNNTAKKEVLPAQATLQNSEQDLILHPWLGQRWFAIAIGLVLASSILAAALFLVTTPFVFIIGLKEQWIVAGLLTVSVLLHEVGHLFTMPRNQHLLISAQWSGPIPLLNIICNEAWKLSKWQRMRINLAGFVADVIVCGLAALIGLVVGSTAPWVWTFLFVHMIRMVFALWPLLPGDGYWVLVDLFDQPNLWAKATTQLKQREISWLSVYALGRYAFLGLIWFLYAYIIYFWGSNLIGRSFDEISQFILYPAPLLISLNMIYIFYSFLRLVFYRKVTMGHLKENE